MHRWFVSRRLWVLIGFLWSLGAILLALVWSVPAFVSRGGPAADADGSLVYHHQVSIVFSSAFAFVLMMVGGFIELWGCHRRTLRSLFGFQVFLDFGAVIGGATLILGIGWFKEILDALGGGYANPLDVQANLQGVLHQSALALALLVPPHALLALTARYLRHAVIRLLTPAEAGAATGRVHRAEGALEANREALNREQKHLSEVEREISRLTRKLEIMPPGDRQGRKALILRQDLRQRQSTMEQMQSRIAKLESENRDLRTEMEEILEGAASIPGAQALILQVLENRQMCDAANAEIAHLHTRGEQARKAAEAVSAGEDAPAEPGAVAVAAPASEKENDRGEDAMSGAAAEGVPVSLQAEGSGPENEEPEDDAAQLRATVRRLNASLKEREEREQQLLDELSALRLELQQEDDQASQRLEKRIGALRDLVHSLRRRVLVVEDDRRLAQVYVQALKATGVLDVREAHKAIDAVRMMQEDGALPDLVVLDIMMPGISGTDFCRSLERHRRTKHIRVIFCSAKLPESIPDLAALSPVAYLRKPVRLAELQRAVLQALGLPAE